MPPHARAAALLLALSLAACDKAAPTETAAGAATATGTAAGTATGTAAGTAAAPATGAAAAAGTAAATGTAAGTAAAAAAGTAAAPAAGAAAGAAAGTAAGTAAAAATAPGAAAGSAPPPAEAAPTPTAEAIPVKGPVKAPAEDSPEAVIMKAIQAAMNPDEAKGWEDFSKLLHSSQQLPNSLTSWRAFNFKAFRRKVHLYLADDTKPDYVIDRVDRPTPDRIKIFVHNERSMPTPCQLRKDPEARGAWRIEICSL